MRASTLVLLASLMLAALACGSRQEHYTRDVSVPEPPVTIRAALSETLHGVDVADPYRWLEEIGSPEVGTWLDAHDARARGVLTGLHGRDALRERLQELGRVDAVTAPRRRGTRLFYARRHADREKSVYYWRDGDDGTEHVLLDPNVMSADTPVSIGVVAPDHEGRRVAYSVRANNADEATLRVLDIESGETSKIDEIVGAKYAWPVWTPDGGGFYYTWLPDDPSVPVDLRPGEARIRFHRLGTDPGTDPVVYGATGDPTRFLGVDLSHDGRWLIVYEHYGWNATDVHVRDLVREGSAFRPLVAGLPARFSIEEHDGTFYVLTNLDAPGSRILAIDPERPGRESWREVVPEAEHAIDDEDGLSIVNGHLLIKYLVDATSELRIHGLDGRHLGTIELPGPGTVGTVTGRPEDDDAFFTFSSFTIPSRVIRASVPGGSTETWSATEVPVDGATMTTRQVWFDSKDGTRVPMFLVHRADLEPTGAVPTLVYGYGGFNVAQTPVFNPWIWPWLESGGLYAVVNLRGGSEFGEAWHRDGMLERKQNVFDDFIAASEWLVENGWSQPDRIAAYGRSNGGLLVGAAMTQRPDLYGAVVCGVPLLDMVRYHQFGSGRTWIGEYGSAENAEQFHALYEYSPYHRVVEGTRYPALLMLSTDADDRVDPMHARKFVAAVEHARKGDAPVLLRVEKNAGHGGSDMVSSQIEMWADILAFLEWRLGGA